MVYIIHNRLIWVLYTRRDITSPWRRLFLPSVRNEHIWPTMVIRL